MQQSHLFTLIREEFTQLLNGYVRNPELTERLDHFIQPPQLGGRAGILGALVLAEQAAAGAAVMQRTPPNGGRA